MITLLPIQVNKDKLVNEVCVIFKRYNRHQNPNQEFTKKNRLTHSKNITQSR